MMTEWTADEIAVFADRFGLAWLTPELLEQLRAAATRAAAAGAAVPRMPSEFCEPAHIFTGPR